MSIPLGARAEDGSSLGINFQMLSSCAATRESFDMTSLGDGASFRTRFFALHMQHDPSAGSPWTTAYLHPGQSVLVHTYGGSPNRVQTESIQRAVEAVEGQIGIDHPAASTSIAERLLTGNDIRDALIAIIDVADAPLAPDRHTKLKLCARIAGGLAVTGLLATALHEDGSGNLLKLVAVIGLGGVVTAQCKVLFAPRMRGTSTRRRAGPAQPPTQADSSAAIPQPRRPLPTEGADQSKAARSAGQAIV